jgi:choline kinase
MSVIGVILSAGRGSRLGLDLPKALVPVAGTTLLELQMLVLSTLCDRIIIVGGYKYGLVEAAAQKYQGGLTPIYNPLHDYGIMVSAACTVRDIADADTVIRLDGDIVMHKPSSVRRGLDYALRTASSVIVARWSRACEGAVEIRVDPETGEVLILRAPSRGRIVPSWAGIDTYKGKDYKHLVASSLAVSMTEPMYAAVNRALLTGLIPRPVTHWIGGVEEIDTPEDLQHVEGLFDA